MNSYSALWILMAWCFSTRPSVATVLSTIKYSNVLGQFHTKVLHLMWTSLENKITFSKKRPSRWRVKWAFVVIGNLFAVDQSNSNLSPLSYAMKILLKFRDFHSIKYLWRYPVSGIILGMGSANERRRYSVMPTLIGRAHTPYPEWSLCLISIFFYWDERRWWVGLSQRQEALLCNAYSHWPSSYPIPRMISVFNIHLFLLRWEEMMGWAQPATGGVTL